MKKPFLYSCFSFLLTAHSAIFSQQLPITHYTPKEGAPVIGANSILQDKNGLIWFTNGHDVMRYDGYEFTSFLPATGCKLDFTYGLIQVNHEIWVLAQPYPVKVSGDSLIPLSLLSQNTFLITGLLYKGESYVLVNNGLHILQNNRLLAVATDSSLVLNNAQTSLLPYQDSLLISYERGKSLVVFHIREKYVRTIDLPVLDIRQDQSGNTLLLLDKVGFVFLRELTESGETWQAKTELFMALPEFSPAYGHFVIDHQNNIWIYEQFEKLVKISVSKTVTVYNESNGLTSLWFNQLYIDQENNLWIGSNGGISKINHSLWERFTKNQGLYFNHIYFILPSDSGRRVFICTEYGTNLFYREKLHQLHTTRNESFRCKALLNQGDRLVYFRDSTLWSARIEISSFRVKEERLLARLPGMGIQMIADSAGTIFIATVKGLVAWHHGRLINMLPFDHYFRRLFIDSRNHIWLGEFAGSIYRYAIEYEKGAVRLTRLELHTSLDTLTIPLNAVRAFCEDKQGNIFAGTRYNGLFQIIVSGLKCTGIRHFDEKAGLANNSVWGLAKDAAGNIWAGTILGLNRLYHKSGKWIIVNESKKRQIFNAAEVVVDARQNLWVATYPGIAKFNIAVTEKVVPFRVFISKLSVPGKLPESINPATPVTLSHLHNNLHIEFSSNSYLDEKGILYSYRLLKKGNEPWAKPSPFHSVNFSALSSGSYIFQLKALNINGYWSENLANLPFTITPPFWQTGWFIVLVAVLVFMLFFGLYRYRIKQILRLQEIRNNISRNLHDDIGASLSNIHILNELANRNLTNTSKASAYLEQAGEDIQHISESISDIVWNINPRYDQIGNLFVRMKRYAADMLDGKDIKSRLDFPGHDVNLVLPMDKRRDLYLIFKEAINNLVKYSGATEAYVAVTLEHDEIRLKVEDNGVGFSLSDTKPGNGLYNMRQRAHKWKAPLEIMSEPGKGTTIRFQMPK